MAKAITPLDAHTIMNNLQAQALGSVAITSTDTSTFVSAGETVMNTGVENTLNALTVVFTQDKVAVREYNAKFTLIQEEDSDLYKTRVRKISFYDKGAKEAGWVNTNTHSKNLYNGYDNGSNGGDSVGSQWEQDKPVCVEFFFSGMNVYDFEITYYPDQVKQAFSSPAAFAAWWNGAILAKQNEIEQYKEHKNQMTLLNYMGGLYDMSMAVDLVAAFNTRFGTNYTGTDLRNTYLKEFLGFLTATIKKYSNYFEERSTAYHWNPSITRDGVTYTALPRHTYKKDQKLFLYKDLFIEAESLVLPEIFHEGMLLPENYEGVTYWQSTQNRDSISITPAIPDTSDPSEQTAGTPVALDHVIGVLFDKDACITNFLFDGSDSTGLEARKRYQNEWMHTAFNSVNDFTEKGILFYMAT